VATIKKTIDVTKELTVKQKKMLERAENMPYVEDKDNPPLTKEELARFKRVSVALREERLENRKQNVTLRLSPQTVKKAKALGKGYTSILAQIIEKALDNPEVAEQLLK
jgi:uncharacterized protein (DUF4415 family)